MDDPTEKDQSQETIEVRVGKSQTTPVEPTSWEPGHEPSADSFAHDADLETPVPAPVGPPPQAVVGHHGRKRWLKILAVIIILAAAIGGGAYAYQKHQDNNKKAAKAAAANKDIPLLRIGIHQADYGDIYPNIANSDYSVSVNAQMFEGLVRYEDASKIVPDLASNWTNPSDTTWVFTIKKGIKFHDGHILAPSDVKNSLDTLIASNSDFAQTFADTIASVQLVGTDQVKITTKAPDPTLLNKLTVLYVGDAKLPKGDEPSLAGTGAYEIKPGTKPTNTSFQMVAFDQYHFGRPTTRALKFSSENETSSLLKNFNAGQYDIAGTVPPAELKQAKNAKLFHVNEADSNFIAFNMVQPGPLQNKLVREAIRYAVNAQAVGKANDEDLIPLSQVVPPSIPGYNPAIPVYKQNIEKAKQLLAQAGYPNGLTLRFSVSTVALPETTEISNELKQVGITVTLDKHADFNEFINYFSSGKAEMYTIVYASDTLDAVDIYQTVLPAANYDNPKVNDLLAQANTTVDPAARLKLLQQVGTIVDQDVPVVPLGSTTDNWVMNKDYAIQQDTASGYIPVYFYTVHLK